MKKEWKKVRLGDFIDILSGYAFKTTEFIDSGIPVIKIKNVNPPIVTQEDVSFVSEETSEKCSKFILNYNDVLIAMTGSHINQINSVVGRVARVKYYNKTLLNQRVGKLLITDKEHCDFDFVYHFLSQFETKVKLANIAGGVANQANISPNDIKGLEITLPPLPTQQKIASILSAYDDLIENNRKQIKLLEEAAQKLYKEWFVKLNFPGHETAKIVDGVPEGWNIQTVNDLQEKLESGSRPKGGIDSSIKNGIASVGAENVIGLGQYNYASEKIVSNEFFEKAKRGIIENKDILIYKDGAYIGRTSLFQDNFPHEKAMVNEHVFTLHAEKESYQYFLFFTLYQKTYFEKMQKLNKNAAQPGINQDAIKSLKLLVPTDNLVNKYDELVTPMVDKIFTLAKQIVDLQSARDKLLPRLMNGELEV